MRFTRSIYVGKLSRQTSVERGSSMWAGEAIGAQWLIFSGLVSAGEDVWRVTVMIQRQTFDSGVIRIGDWDFPCQLGRAGRSRVCKIHRMLGENWTQTTAEELQAMLEERLGLI